MFDAEKVTKDCVQWIRDWFEKSGKGCNAVIGISGGKDSSVVAALCVQALGKERVIGVLLPDYEQEDIDMSNMLVEFLGIKSFTIDISYATTGIKQSIREAYPAGLFLSDQALINMPARIRMTMLYAVSQSLNGRVSNNCNLSEDWIGYSTKYGDAAGDFSPLCHLTVTEVKQIGRVLGLPDVLIDKAPSDGLCGKTDEENFGFSYDVLDKYIRTGEISDMKVKAKIDTLHEKNLFKLQPMEGFVYPSIDSYV